MPARLAPGGAFLLLALLLASATLSHSQTDSASVRAVPRVEEPLPDSTVTGTVVPGPATASKSPWTAVGLSAALPGAGQIYTKNYWKVPVIWGLGGYYMYEWFKQNDKYKDYRARYAASVTPTTPNGSEQLLNNRDFYRDQRDSFAWYMGVLYFLNLVDAYVDAHLYDFDVSPELTSDGRVVPAFRATVHLPLY
jgi:hypothetical protein